MAAKLVNRLRALSFLDHADAADFMAQMTANCAAWDGSIARTDLAEVVTGYLLAIGFLQPA